MIQLFKKINIEKIEFQSNVNEVSLICKMTINEQQIQHEIIINYSQLNKLLGKIQQITKLGDIYSRIKQTKISEESMFYYLEGNDFELDSDEFETIAPLYAIKQIKS
jgi:ABC-type transport system involved in Fe-S cluster assembly fused permease/ATPase subunit